MPEVTCDDLRVLVDQNNALPADYVPEDLVSLWDHGVPTLGSDAPKLRSAATRDLKVLVEAAAADGEELVVASAYRSYEDQRTSHERLASVYGEEGAHAMSAKAGHSQHQLGTAIDFTNAQAGYQVWEPFGQTSASAWLEVNAKVCLMSPGRLDSATFPVTIVLDTIGSVGVTTAPTSRATQNGRPTIR